MSDKVSINVKVSESLRDNLKKIAKDKGALFHPWLTKELEKIASRNKDRS
ncbi:hypothetical protein NVP1162O_41 [Vibrio phage 1.162.O._10N.261.48.E3]|nr:hypothetical protein NVP1147O_41 [Vibrio phage 1.147.O._10N.286.49.E9]AUR91711.1 hypothetical protein NVP1162O_41 [Vibrio phage 1.162.O._10N.261.48.E3]AUR96849.1 hypothetical protein NVP1233A_36 [Vibrio phage 1.233.A._10N.261.51.E6]AUR96909.1 hypothetical protein NVP1233B_36 [Vibrio phage 1.233.B._10N.261.51.E6]